ncbi:hypothetical protein BH11PLA2_BH11PLA2_41890 [soil metagenome]
MEMHINGTIVRCAQCGGGTVITRNGIDHPPTNAEFHLWIDGHHTVDAVYLPDGMMQGRNEIRVERAPVAEAVPSAQTTADSKAA